MNEEILLEMRNICKEFPSVKALDGVSLCVRRGTVHALMGENGAGKSTLMKCLFGVYKRDAGEILLERKPVHFKSPAEALRGGVAMVQQELSQAAVRSVMDNIWLGRYPKKLGFVVDERKMYEDTKRIFEEFGIAADPRRIMRTLPVAERQMADIAKAVSYHAKIVVLDEPTSSLNDAEAERLFAIMEKLKAKGCGILYISHKMEEILRISDEVTIMRDGKLIDTKPASELTTDKIVKLMVGRDLSERFPEKTNRPGEVALTVQNLTAAHAPVRDISFTLRKGEILGFAGLGGAGRTELLECLFGLRAKKDGKIFLSEKRVFNKTPRDSIQNGFALLTEERRQNGIFGILDITANTTISSLPSYRRFWGLDTVKMRKDTADAVVKLRVKTPSTQTKIRALSGGNQQKVILARWLLTKPRILLLDEPTRGVDVGAKYEIYRLIIDLAEKGHSIVFVSSEMPELLGISDRILVISGGKIAGEVDPSTATQEQIMTLAAKYV